MALGVEIEGTPALTRFFVQYTGTAPVNADLNTFNGSVSSAYNTNLKALVDTDTVLTQLESVDLTSATGAVATTAASVTGTRAGNTTPNEAAVVISYEISRRYRGGHPRGYWRAGVVTDLATTRTWSTSFLSSLKTGYNAFMTSVLAAGWTGAGTLTHVNVSYYHGFTVVINPITGRARNVPSLRTTPVVDLVTDIICRPGVGTQRRRNEFAE